MQYSLVIRKIIFISSVLLCFLSQNIFAASKNIQLAANTAESSSLPSSKLFHYVDSVTSLKEAISSSLAKGKPVFIMYSATWCGYCKAADRDVFSDSQVQKALQSVTTLRVDASDNTPEQANMMDLYDVQGFPTIIGYNKQGSVTALQQAVSVSSILDFVTQLSK